MSCLVVEDCEIAPNPWFDKEGQVESNSDKGINVTHERVLGTSTVVEWKLTFTKPSQEDIVGTYTCRISPTTDASATLEKAGE